MEKHEPENCPNSYCGNSGGYPVPDGHGDWQEEQCEFCWTNPNSVFNLKKAGE